MNLFRVLALVTRDPDNKNYPRDLALLRNEGQPASYSIFQKHGWLEEEFTETLIALLAGSTRTMAFSPLSVSHTPPSGPIMTP